MDAERKEVGIPILGKLLDAPESDIVLRRYGRSFGYSSPERFRHELPVHNYSKGPS